MPLHTRIAETLERVNLPLLASALTFDALLAIIPLAILIIALLSVLMASATPAELFARFLPAHAHGSTSDPFSLIERLVTAIQTWNNDKLTWIAIPLSLWFSSRLFAAVRVCLSAIFQVRQQQVKGHFVWSYVAGYLLAKARDVVIALIVLVLALANTVATSIFAVVTARGVTVDPQWRFLLTTGGKLAGQGVAFLLGIILFIVLYRYASPKRLAWPGALLASAVGTLGFEVAKRLYGLYLTRVPHGGQYAIDASVGAGLLFILWLWYMAFIFLLGAAVADVWDRAHHARVIERAVAKQAGAEH